MRHLLTFASLVGAVVLPLAVISAVVTNLVFDSGFYHAGQARYDVQSVTHLSPATMDRVNVGIVRFFGNSETLPQSLSAVGAPPDVFNEREILHMNDVRGLIQGIRVLQFGALAYVLAVSGLAATRWPKGGRAAVSRMLLLSTVVTIGVGILAAIITYFWFDQLFLWFHEVSFHNDFWQLDPRTDHLIQMFPFGFWYDAMLIVTERVLIVTLIIGGCGYALRRADRAANRLNPAAAVVPRR
ncbi:MAG TPA: TIGR01906 family membrane protein [Chloroflexota bacterium]|nr:TIGR01906 family membrane protein [Chloroflexota bacterium]